MKFIILTTKNGTKYRLNPNHLISYWLVGKTTEIQTTQEFTQVAETVEEIDNLLKELGA